jgi:signal transduction histidine kinase
MPEVLGDETRLVEVYLNLIENAVKFMGAQDSPQVHIGFERSGDTILCHVRDNGVGIDEKFQHQVFELFERLDAKVEGTGVGLALVKRIIEVHGGRIWIESAGEGQGSTVKFSLPASLTPARFDESPAEELRSIA